MSWSSSVQIVGDILLYFRSALHHSLLPKLHKFNFSFFNKSVKNLMGFIVILKLVKCDVLVFCEKLLRYNVAIFLARNWRYQLGLNSLSTSQVEFIPPKDFYKLTPTLFSSPTNFAEISQLSSKTLRQHDNYSKNAEYSWSHMI